MRKGRGNAILTYETVSAIDHKLTEVGVKVDNMQDALRRREAMHDDHEVRLRALELSHAALASSSHRASTIWAWLIPVALSIITTLVSVMTFARIPGK